MKDDIAPWSMSSNSTRFRANILFSAFITLYTLELPPFPTTCSAWYATPFTIIVANALGTVGALGAVATFFAAGAGAAGGFAGGTWACGATAGVGACTGGVDAMDCWAGWGFGMG